MFGSSPYNTSSLSITEDRKKINNKNVILENTDKQLNKLKAFEIDDLQHLIECLKKAKKAKESKSIYSYYNYSYFPYSLNKGANPKLKREIAFKNLKIQDDFEKKNRTKNLIAQNEKDKIKPRTTDLIHFQTYVLNYNGDLERLIELHKKGQGISPYQFKNNYRNQENSNDDIDLLILDIDDTVTIEQIRNIKLLENLGYIYTSPNHLLKVDANNNPIEKFRLVFPLEEKINHKYVQYLVHFIHYVIQLETGIKDKCLIDLITLQKGCKFNGNNKAIFYNLNNSKDFDINSIENINFIFLTEFKEIADKYLVEINRRELEKKAKRKELKASDIDLSYIQDTAVKYFDYLPKRGGGNCDDCLTLVYSLCDIFDVNENKENGDKLIALLEDTNIKSNKSQGWNITRLVENYKPRKEYALKGASFFYYVLPQLGLSEIEIKKEISKIYKGKGSRKKQESILDTSLMKYYIGNAYLTKIDQSINCRFLPKDTLVKGNNIAVKSKLGTGKTTAVKSIKQAIESAKNFYKDKKILMITHRRSLVQVNAQNFGLTVIDGENDIDDTRLESIKKYGASITYDSLAKLKGYINYSDYIVVLDEARQGLEHLVNGKTEIKNRRGHVIKTLSEMLTQSSQIILLDAHLNDKTVSFFGNLSSKTFEVIENKYSSERKRKACFYDDKKVFLDRIFREIDLAVKYDLNLILPIDSKRLCEQVNEYVRITYPEVYKETLLYTSDTMQVNSHIKNLLNCEGFGLKGKRIVIFSPVLQSGVSINIDKPYNHAECLEIIQQIDISEKQSILKELKTLPNSENLTIFDVYNFLRPKLPYDDFMRLKSLLNKSYCYFDKTLANFSVVCPTNAIQMIQRYRTKNDLHIYVDDRLRYQDINSLEDMDSHISSAKIHKKNIEKYIIDDLANILLKRENKEYNLLRLQHQHLQNFYEDSFYELLRLDIIERKYYKELVLKGLEDQDCEISTVNECLSESQLSLLNDTLNTAKESIESTKLESISSAIDINEEEFTQYSDSAKLTESQKNAHSKHLLKKYFYDTDLFNNELATEITKHYFLRDDKRKKIKAINRFILCKNDKMLSYYEKKQAYFAINSFIKSGLLCTNDLKDYRTEKDIFDQLGLLEMIEDTELVINNEFKENFKNKALEYKTELRRAGLSCSKSDRSQEILKNILNHFGFTLIPFTRRKNERLYKIDYLIPKTDTEKQAILREYIKESFTRIECERLREYEKSFKEFLELKPNRDRNLVNNFIEKLEDKNQVQEKPNLHICSEDKNQVQEKPNLHICSEDNKPIAIMNKLENGKVKTKDNIAVPLPILKDYLARYDCFLMFLNKELRLLRLQLTPNNELNYQIC